LPDPTIFISVDRDKIVKPPPSISPDRSSYSQRHLSFRITMATMMLVTQTWIPDPPSCRFPLVAGKFADDSLERYSAEQAISKGLGYVPAGFAAGRRPMRLNANV